MKGIDRSQAPRYLTGLTAVAVSIWFLYNGRAEPSIVVASSFFLLICITDTLYSKIFNAANLTLLIAGFAVNYAVAGPGGLLFSLWGIVVGLALLLLPYLMGGMGAGDVKALAALGGLIGASQVFQVFLYTVLIGGLLGLLHMVFSPGFSEKVRSACRRMRSFILTRELQAIRPAVSGDSVRFPYAAAIAFGFFSYVSWGRIL